MYGGIYGNNGCYYPRYQPNVYFPVNGMPNYFKMVKIIIMIDIISNKILTIIKVYINKILIEAKMLINKI